MPPQVSESRLKLTAEDATGRGMASAARNADKLARDLEAASRRADQAFGRIEAGAARVGKGAAAIAGGLGLGVGLAQAGRIAKDSYMQFASFDRQLTRIGITANASGEEMNKVGDALKGMASKYGVPLEQITGGLDTLVASGRTLQSSMAFLPTVVETAHSSGAAIEDVAKSADALANSMGITGDKMSKAMDILAAGGAAGNFELKDMARYLPGLAPLVAAVGYKGEDGLSKLVAILQVVRKQTGDAGQAADATRDLFQKLGSEEIANRFEKMGGDLTGRLQQWRTEGKDVLAEFIQYSREVLQNKANGQMPWEQLIPDLAGDVQFTTALRALLTMPGAVRDLRKELSQADGTVIRNLGRVTTDAASDAQRLADAFGNVEKALGKLLSSMHVPQGLEWLANTLNTAAKGAENIAELGVGGSMTRAFNIKAYNEGVQEFEAKKAEVAGAKSPAQKQKLEAELREMEARLEIARRRVYETGTAEDRKSLRPDGMPLPPELPGALAPELRDADPRGAELRRKMEEAEAARAAVGGRRPGESRGDFLAREREAELERLRAGAESKQYDYNSRYTPNPAADAFADGMKIDNPRGAQEQTLKSIDRRLDQQGTIFRQFFNPTNINGGAFGGARFSRAAYGDVVSGNDPVGAGFGGSGVGIGGGGPRGGTPGAPNMRYGRGGRTPGGGGLGGITGGGSTAPTNAEGKANVASWLAFAQKPVDQGGLGLTKEQAHGMVAGLQGESGVNLNPGAWNPDDRGMPSGGTAQWRDDRLRNLQAFAQARGQDWRSMEIQQQFLRHEMIGSGGLGGGSERAAYDRIRSAGTRQQALYAHVAGFERPQFPDTEAQRRAAYLYGHGDGGGGPIVDAGDLRVKGGARGQAFAGGETMPGTIAAARDYQRYGLPGGVSHFSAFNDRFHAGTGSKHADGLAFDTTLATRDRQVYAQAAEAARNRIRASGLSDKDFTVIDEMNNPSGRSTGPHIHTQFNSREAAAQYNQWSARQEAERVAAGEKAKAPAASSNREPTAYERWQARRNGEGPKAKLDDLDVSGGHAEKAAKARADMRAAVEEPIYVDVQPRIANAERLRDRTRSQSVREVDRSVRDARLNTYSDVGVG